MLEVVKIVGLFSFSSKSSQLLWKSQIPQDLLPDTFARRPVIGMC